MIEGVVLMKTILMNAQNLQDIYSQATPCVMALGYFDGVHLGHQRVIEIACKEANNRGLPLALMSFRPHPINILSGGKRCIPHLTTLSEKEMLLNRLGVDIFYLVDFTLDFAALSPKQFVETYLLKLGVTHAVAGFDFSYGSKGAGKLKHIPDDSKNQITVTEVQRVDYLGEKISSTAIRKRLLSTDIHEIPHFLGKHYTVKTLWDGNQFKPLEQTMLPNKGIYEVMLEYGQHKMRSIVSINEYGSLRIMKAFDKLTKGIVKIHWLQPSQSRILTRV